MKKIFSATIIAGLVTLLLVPGGSNLLSRTASASFSAAPIVVNIVVTRAAPVQQVVVAAPSSQSIVQGSCSWQALTSSLFLQSASQLNLNQPANCFTLVLARPVAQPTLAVLPLQAALPQIIVTNSGASLSPLSVNRAEPLNPIALPAVAVIILAMTMAEDRKIRSNFKGSSGSVISLRSLNIHQLGVMRC